MASAALLFTASLDSEPTCSKQQIDKLAPLFIHVIEAADSSWKRGYRCQKQNLPKQARVPQKEIDIREHSEDGCPASHPKNRERFGTAIVSINNTQKFRNRCWTSSSDDVPLKKIESTIGLEDEPVRDIDLDGMNTDTESSFEDRVSSDYFDVDRFAQNDDPNVIPMNEDSSDVTCETENGKNMDVTMQKRAISNASTFPEDEFEIPEWNHIDVNDHLVNDNLKSLVLNAVAIENKEEVPESTVFSEQEVNHTNDKSCAELDDFTQDNGQELLERAVFSEREIIYTNAYTSAENDGTLNAEHSSSHLFNDACMSKVFSTEDLPVSNVTPSQNQVQLRSIHVESITPDMYHVDVVSLDTEYAEADRNNRHKQQKNMKWEKVWQCEDDCIGNSIPTISEEEYAEIINTVLEMARSLPINITLQEQLDPLKGHINTVCSNVILYRLQKEGLFLHAMSFFEWMWLHTPCLLDSRSLCTMFTMLGAANKANRALLLYENLKDRKELWTVQVFNAALSMLSKLGRYDESLKFFQEMLKMSIKPDNVTLSILINSAEKHGSKVGHIWKMFCRMEQQNTFASHEVFGALIKVFCNKGMKEEALKLMSEMEKRGLVLNAMIYNTVINAYGKSGMLEEAEGLISDMRKQGLVMTVVTYNCLIAAYGKQKMFETAEALLQEMLAKGPLPNERTYTILVAAYGRHGLTEKAVNVFLRMKRIAISPNVISYTALIHAYAETGWHKKAEYAFQNMIREGIVPTIETYTSLLHGYRQAGDIESVKATWKSMCKENCKGTRATFNVLMDAFAKHGCYAEARDVMYEFNRIGYMPDTQTYNILINAYARGGRHSRIPDILEEMKSKGITPDCFTYTTVIYSYLRVRDFSMAFKYHDVMLKDNQLPDFLTYSKLRTILDAQHEIKSQRNMKACIGLQRKKHESPQNTNAGKRTWERRKTARTHMHRKAKLQT